MPRSRPPNEIVSQREKQNYGKQIFKHNGKEEVFTKSRKELIRTQTKIGITQKRKRMMEKILTTK